MAYPARADTTRHLSDTAWHVITAIVAVVGVIAAALGAFIEFGPVDGTVSIFNWTWNIADLSSLWAPMLMIGGGLGMLVSMGYESLRDWDREAAGWLVMLEALVALIGVAAVVVGVVILF